jgi:glycerate 2-kinase
MAAMLVVVAPDKFAGTLTAVQAAEAIRAGWLRHAPADEVRTVPMSDGGPGFLDVLEASLGGDLVAATVPGPLGEEVPAAVLRVGETAYVESAQAVGLHLTPDSERDPERASSHGLGVLLRRAVDSGARRIVVGLGGSGTNDGGAGMLAALGATARGGSLEEGPRGLAGLDSVDLTAARAALAGVELVAATDVESPLLGIVGATKTFGPQKGVAEDRLVTVDGWLQGFAECTDRKAAAVKGAGAAGGIGFALMLLGAERVPGVELVAESVGLAGALRGADLAVTGEGSFDFSSRAGKVPYGVAQLAEQALAPCVVLAGRVEIGAREMRALGVESAYSLVELAGTERAFADAARALADVAERVARTWSR